MLKRLFAVILLAVIFTTANAGARPAISPGSPTIPPQEKLLKLKNQNVVEYWWILGNDGCYHLYRLEIVQDILEFWTPLGYWNYIGTTTNCVYTADQMEAMC